MAVPKIYVIILNYNGWTDTIECLESVLRNNYPNYQVIVVDNNSTDNSLKYIKAWAEGKLDVWIKPNNPLKHLCFPPVKKPIPYVSYCRKEAEKGGNKEQENKLIPHTIRNNNAQNTIISTSPYPLIFIQTHVNLGFAGGNNIGIKYALAKNDFEFVWLLNNDTVIERDSLLKLVHNATLCKEKKIGIIGSKLLYYHKPDTIQGIGGIYNKWFGVSKHLGAFEKDKGQYDNKKVLKKIDYIIGASMLVSSNLIKKVGLLCEDYFLYFEDIDWALRAKNQNFELDYCWESKVYHKEGKSIGSSLKGKEKSDFSDFYGLKNRIVFTKKFFPKWLWSVYAGFLVVFFNRIERKKIGVIIKLLRSFNAQNKKCKK
jgi:GT2 family glycosyltransferase